MHDEIGISIRTVKTGREFQHTSGQDRNIEEKGIELQKLVKVFSEQGETSTLVATIRPALSEVSRVPGGQRMFFRGISVSVITSHKLDKLGPNMSRSSSGRYHRSGSIAL